MKTTKKINKKAKPDDKTINLNEEIIIGLTPKKQNNVKSKKRTSSNKREIKKTNKVKNNSKKKVTKNKIQKKEKMPNKKSKVAKWIILIILIILCVILFLLSSVFNIKKIVIQNNNKTTTEEIIELSEIKTEENMFKISNKKIRKNLKSNPYIEDVKIKKKLNGTIELNVTERVATFIIKYLDTYAYINNQGYILELSQEPLELPILIGISTLEENIKPGNRLDNKDLEKLDTVIKIIANAKSLKLDSLITSIDITNSNDYIIKMDQELKTVHFGDKSNINDKMTWVLEIIEQKKDVEGEIFVKNPDKNVYFREKV